MGHDDAWFAAARLRRRQQYAVTHPSKGGHGRKPLPADAGRPKRRERKLNLGAAAGMMIDMSPGLALGVAPEGHPSQADLEINSARVRARWADPVSVTEPAKVAEPVQVGEAEWHAVEAAATEEEAALEAYRVACGSNPNADRRPLAERRDHPLPGADDPDGRGWLAAQGRARSRLAIARRHTSEAHAAHESAMRETWDAADTSAYTVFAAGADDEAAVS